MELLRFAVLAAAPDAPEPAVQGLLDARDRLLEITNETKFRVAHLIGQCAHESLRFTHDTENLFYTTPQRIQAVWPSRFPSIKSARPFAKNPEGLANKVYGGRSDLGNTESGDGWKFRGRGYIQLTGRANYTKYGEMIGIDLVADPGAATDPKVAWQLATAYMATRKRKRRTVFEWADLNNVEQVTRAINGGVHGLADRKLRTFHALEALDGVEVQPELSRGEDGVVVVLLQRALALAGFSPGGQDGRFGPATLKALLGFQKAEGLDETGKSDTATWEALDLASDHAHRLTATGGPRKPAPAPVPAEPKTATEAAPPAVTPAPKSQFAPATAPMPIARPKHDEPKTPSPEDQPVLRRGRSGEHVVLLQLALALAGFPVTSRFGPSTEQAVRSFQASKGLTVDGIVGPNTWKALAPLPG
ncbi:MAG: peptidoglycan-binding protein [Pseudomonadota bacterium]